MSENIETQEGNLPVGRDSCNSNDSLDQEVLRKWTAVWEIGSDKEADLFVPILSSAHEKACRSAKHHRELNFEMKKRFVTMFWTSIAAQILYIVFVGAVFSSPAWIYIINQMFKTNHSLHRLLDLIPLSASLLAAIEAAIVLFMVITSIGVNKWIQIKKCQETWARQTALKHKLNCEMIKFIYSIDGYKKGDTDKKRELFIENILAILDTNIEKFVRNLEEKEHSLTEDIIGLYKPANASDDET